MNRGTQCYLRGGPYFITIWRLLGPRRARGAVHYFCFFPVPTDVLTRASALIDSSLIENSRNAGGNTGGS